MVRLAVTWVLAAALFEVIAAQQTHDEGQHGRTHGSEGEHTRDPEGESNHEHAPPGRGWGQPTGGDPGRHEGGERNPPPACSAEDSHQAVVASKTYMECADVNYEDFLALVQADLDLMEGTALCFTASVDKMEQDKKLSDKDEVDLVAMFEKCIDQVEGTDGTAPTQATADFLKKMIGPDSKICSCMPAYADQMPLCDQWHRFHHFGQRVEALCKPILENAAFLPLTVEEEHAQGTSTQAAGSGAEKAQGQPATATEPEVQATEEESNRNERTPKFPNHTPPCPAGQEVHPTDPTKCQGSPPKDSELYDTDFGGEDGRGPPPDQGGILGLALPALGVLGVCSLVGIGGVWLYRKFQSGTRQPGVRYMATGVDNDMGTELGPFGREYP